MVKHLAAETSTILVKEMEKQGITRDMVVTILHVDNQYILFYEEKGRD